MRARLAAVLIVLASMGGLDAARRPRPEQGPPLFIRSAAGGNGKQ